MLTKGNSSQRPYQVEHTGSRPITAVKQPWAWLVLRWVTAWEHRVLLAWNIIFVTYAPAFLGNGSNNHFVSSPIRYLKYMVFAVKIQLPILYSLHPMLSGRLVAKFSKFLSLIQSMHFTQSSFNSRNRQTQQIIGYRLQGVLYKIQQDDMFRST